MLPITHYVTGFSFNIDKDYLAETFIDKQEGATMNDLLECFNLTVEEKKENTVCKFIFKEKEHFIIIDGNVSFVDKNFEERLLSVSDLQIVLNAKGNRLIILTSDESLRIIRPIDALITKMLEEWYTISNDLTIIRQYCKDSKVRTYRFRKVIDKQNK